MQVVDKLVIFSRCNLLQGSCISDLFAWQKTLGKQTPERLCRSKLAHRESTVLHPWASHTFTCVSSITTHQVKSMSTHTGHFAVWHWTAVARSSSCRRASPPRSGRQSPEPKVPGAPTGAGASAVRAPWLCWEGGGKIRQRREGWKPKGAVTIKYLLKRAEKKKKNTCRCWQSF